MPHGKRIAELLIDIGAVKLSLDPPFTWTSGIKSPIYCDNRMIYSHPAARNVVVDALVNRVKSLHIPADVIAGTATAAIGWAALVADRLSLPFVYVRSNPKDHGMKKRIEGQLMPAKQVVVIEDLLSTGGSAVSTIDALREEGKCFVADVVSIFTYEFLSCTENAQRAGVHVHPLCAITTLLEVAVEQGRITEEQRDSVVAFVREPERLGKV